LRTNSTLNKYSEYALTTNPVRLINAAGAIRSTIAQPTQRLARTSLARVLIAAASILSSLHYHECALASQLNHYNNKVNHLENVIIGSENYSGLM